MIRSRSPLLEQVAREIFPTGGLVAARRLTGGISAQTTAMTVQLPGGELREIVLRQFPNIGNTEFAATVALEFRLVEFLHRAGIPVPQPLFLDESGTIFRDPYWVMVYVEGKAEYSPTDPARFGRTLADLLSAIHRLPADSTLLQSLPRKSNQIQRMLDAPPSASTSASTSASALVPVLQEEAAIEARLARMLAANRERLCADDSTFLHGDFWPGNLLWQAGNVVAILDWEDAGLGNPLADVAVARLDLLWIAGAEAMTAFTQRYLEHCPQLPAAELALWDLYAARRALPWLDEAAAGWAENGRPDITASVMRTARVRFLESALATLEGVTRI